MRNRLTLTLGIALGCLLVVGGLSYTFFRDNTAAGARLAAVPPLELPPAGQPAPEIDWNRTADLGKDLPSSLLVYRLLRGSTGLERARRMADAFAVTGEAECGSLADGVSCAVVAPSRSVAVDSDGRVVFTSSARVRTDADGSEPCTDDEAAAFATDFLQKNGFLPDGSGFALAGVGPLGSMAGTRDGVPYQADYGKLISFHRSVDGLPVYGVSRLTVGIDRLDGQLQVVTLTSAWHPLEPYAELPLRSIDDAYAYIVAGKADADMSMGGKATVERASLAYYEPPIIYEQPFLQPVYVFEGTVRSGDQSDSFSVLVPALADSALAEPTPTVAPAVGEPIVPTGPIESARVRRDGQWIDLSQEQAQAIMAGAARTLDSAPDALAVTPSLTGGLRVAERLERWRLSTVWVEGVVDVVFAEPLEFALALPAAPPGTSTPPLPEALTRNRLPLDDAGHTRVIAQRLMITVEAEGSTFVFAFLPRPGEDGQALDFQLQWPNDPDNPALVLLRQLIMGEAAAME